MDGLEAALLEAVDFLESEHLGYAVIGGLALAHWGLPRATRDVDFKVAVPDSEYDRVAAKVRAAFPEPGRPGLRPNPLIVSVRIREVIVDFLLAIPGYEHLLVERAVSGNVLGRAVAFCSAEDLIVQKIVADRERDWLDVKSILVARRSELDLVYVRNWVSQFAEALDRPELVARLEALL